MSDYLYIIHCNDDIYKIGIAHDVSKRLAQLQTGNPYRLTLIASYEFHDSYTIEAAVHSKFDHNRMNGEWFKLNQNDLYKIDQICDMFDGKKVAIETVASSSEVDNAEEELSHDFDAMIAEGWRWQKHGSGKYSGKYFQWVRGSGKSREYAPGGMITESMLPKRPGKGNKHPKGHRP